MEYIYRPLKWVNRFIFYLESGEGIGGNIKGGHFNIFEEVVEELRVEYDTREGLMTSALAQHCATVQGYLRLLVPGIHRDSVLYLCVYTSKYIYIIYIHLS